VRRKEKRKKGEKGESLWKRNERKRKSSEKCTREDFSFSHVFVILENLKSFVVKFPRWEQKMSEKIKRTS